MASRSAWVTIEKPPTYNPCSLIFSTSRRRSVTKSGPNPDLSGLPLINGGFRVPRRTFVRQLARVVQRKNAALTSRRSPVRSRPRVRSDSPGGQRPPLLAPGGPEPTSNSDGRPVMWSASRAKETSSLDNKLGESSIYAPVAKWLSRSIKQQLIGETRRDGSSLTVTPTG